MPGSVPKISKREADRAGRQLSTRKTEAHLRRPVDMAVWAWNCVRSTVSTLLRSATGPPAADRQLSAPALTSTMALVSNPPKPPPRMR
jgi:hypothetical protein